MNRGFKYYFDEALTASAKTIYKNKCFFRFILYSIAEFFGRLLIVFNLHFNLSAVRQGYVARKCNMLNFSSSFKDTGKRASVWTYLLTVCLQALIAFAGFVVICAAASAFGGIGYGISKLVNYEKYEIFVLLFTAPFVPLCAVYMLIAFLIFSPTAYIIANNAGISAGEAIASCFRTMLGKGKGAVFAVYFVSGLLRLLYFTAVGTGGYFLLTEVVPSNMFAFILVIWIIASLLLYLTFAPVLTLATRVFKERLFEDIVLDPVTAVRLNEKVNVKESCGKVLTRVTAENMQTLFECAEDPCGILEKAEKKSQIFILPDGKKKNIKRLSEPSPATERAELKPREQQIQVEKTQTVLPKADSVVSTQESV